MIPDGRRAWTGSIAPARRVIGRERHYSKLSKLSKVHGFLARNTRDEITGGGGGE